VDKIIIDPQVFRRILNRNVIWPLIIGLLSATFFIAIVYYLLSISRWVESADSVIRKTNEVLKLCLDRETGLRGYIITGNEEFLEPYQRAKGSISSQIDELRELVADNTEQRARLDNIVLLSTRWLDYAKNIIALRDRSGDVSNGVRNGVGKKIMDDLRTEFSGFLLEEERIKSVRYNSAKDTVYTLIGLFLLFSILVAALLAYWGRRDLLYLSNTYDRVVQKQREHAEFLQRQAWLRDGQTELANKVVGQLSLATVCNNTLHFLCQYLDAAVGAIYVMENDKTLKRVSTYAFSAEAQLSQQSFQIGESLVGQAALEQRLLQVQDMAGAYFQVNSGLGATLPSSILVLPVAVDREVNAVVELGFARITGAREIDLLEQVAENIASLIAAANYRQRLQVVLWETQQLNDELQAQQEELRAANEELEDQARLVEEAQNRLESQHAELEQTNTQLEEQAAALELSRDIVEQKNSDLSHAHYLLEERARELERASRYKSEFLANMSHELRTPLNSSLILSKLLAENNEGNLTPEQIKFAQSIYAAGNDLLELINDILDISKVEAGKLEMRADNVALRKFFESMEDLFRPLASEKGIDFSIELAADLPQTLFVDQKRLAQILKNLLSNAIKFTDRSGRVALTVHKYSAQEIAIVVKDSGIGIKEEYQQEIFEAFRQGDGATNRKYGGTGLGLSISRELARLLGGSIKVRSEPGKGSEFTLVIPCVYRDVTPILPRRESTPPAIAARDSSAGGPGEQAPRFEPPPFADDREHLSNAARTILIIEDEPQFAEILYDLARQQRFNCLVASGADQGFDTALRYLPSAILLDMKLPDHSGLTVLERLKSNPKTRHIPVHIISVEDYSEVALLLGAVGYLTKPVSRDALKTTLVKLEERLDQKLKRVLVVEDDAVQRASIEQLIDADDIEIVGVERGDLALQMLKEKVFDCMITDLLLPDMSGAELLRRMTSEAVLSYPPIIVYTGRSLSAAEEAELLSYSRSIIIKGARSPERLLDEVMLFLHKVEADLPADQQRMLHAVRSRERVFEGRKILVADDDVRNIFALTSVLEQKGARVEVSRNGREALEKLQLGCDIDLVLMDIMMPEMDGYEAIQKIRADPRFLKLPIIAVTAKAMRDDHERCLRAGANDYLAKPIDIDRLLSLVRVWMPQAQRF